MYYPQQQPGTVYVAPAPPLTASQRYWGVIPQAEMSHRTAERIYPYSTTMLVVGGLIAAAGVAGFIALIVLVMTKRVDEIRDYNLGMIGLGSTLCFFIGTVIVILASMAKRAYSRFSRMPTGVNTTVPSNAQTHDSQRTTVVSQGIAPSYAPRGQPLMMAPSYAPYGQPTMMAPSYASYGEPTMMAPSYAPYDEPTMMAPSYAPYDEPTMMAPSYAPYGQPTMTAYNSYGYAAGQPMMTSGGGPVHVTHAFTPTGQPQVPPQPEPYHAEFRDPSPAPPFNETFGEKN